jgi:hypothetical protein
MSYPRALALGALVAAVPVIIAALIWLGLSTGARAQEEPSCPPDWTQVQNFTGTQDQTTPPFDIEGAEWRYILEARATTETSGSLSVDPQAEEEGAVPIVRGFETLTTDQEPEVLNSDVLDGPGTFTLDIDANGSEYTIVVCERGTGGGDSKNKTGGTTTPKKSATSQPKTSPTPPPPPSPQPTPAPAPPFKAGGAEAGPVPLMPNGSCPKEFPIRQGKACYAD